MATRPERTHKRHVRENATIDHLVEGVSKPTAPDEKHPGGHGLVGPLQLALGPPGTGTRARLLVTRTLELNPAV